MLGLTESMEHVFLTILYIKSFGQFIEMLIRFLNLLLKSLNATQHPAEIVIYQQAYVFNVSTTQQIT